MILTVISGRNEEDWFDIEVPEDCPAGRLNEMLGLRLYREPAAPGMQYILEARFPEGFWFKVEANAASIAEAGLREGNYVRLQRAFSTTDEEAPVYGKRLLFQDA